MRPDRTPGWCRFFIILTCDVDNIASATIIGGMRQLTIELLAIRAIVELPDTDSTRPSPGSTEELDAMTREVFAALRPRPLASTRPSNVVPMRKVGSR